MQLIIDIPEDVYKRTVFYREFKDLNDCVKTIKALENATPLDDVKAEIKQGYCTANNDYDKGRNYGLYMATQILDNICRK